MSVVVHVQTQAQRLSRRVELGAGESLSIGRGWDNDIVVDDEYVDPAHLRIRRVEDGGLQVVDLSTRNGSRLAKRRLIGESAYGFGTPLTIGDSIVTLHDASASVVPARALDTVQRASRRLASPLWWMLATSLAVASLLGIQYLLNPYQATSRSIGDELLGFLIAGVVWTLLAGLVGKLFRHRTLLPLHWMTVCMGMCLLFVLPLLSHVLQFNIDSQIAQTLLPLATASIGIAVFAYTALAVCTRLGSRLRFGLAGVLALLPLAFALVESVLVEEHLRWRDHATLERTNLPPALLLRPPVSVDAHFDQFERLFPVLDAQVQTSMTERDRLPPPPAGERLQLSEGQ